MPELRLLTANLWNGRARPAALAEAIERTEPDVVLVQELAPDQARAIERHLSYGILLPRCDKRGMGLALRRPAQVALLPLPRRDALVARLLPGEWGTLSLPLEILNVHMSAPTRLSRLPLRRKQLRVLREYLELAPMRRVLAGDLNSFRLMPAYRVLRGLLRDAALEHRAWGQPTWGPGARWPRLLRIDHVLLHGLGVLDVQVLRIDGSDHSAVLARLTTD